MASSVRYKYVINPRNTSSATSALTESDLIGNDGDDKQQRVIKRVISGGDIGTNPGQLGDPYGAIADILPRTVTVLMVEGVVYRPGSVKQNGMTIYNIIDNQIDTIPPTGTCEVNYGVGLDNSIRIIDKSHDGPVPLKEGDVVMLRITIGTRQDPLDVMNP